MKRTYSEIRKDGQANRLAQEFARLSRVKPKLVYFQILKALLEIDKSAKKIAEEAGVSPSFLSNNYDHFFAPFLEAKTLAERERLNQKARAERRVAEIQEEAATTNRAIQKIVDAAKQAGMSVVCSVHQVNEHQTPARAHQRAIYIGGKKCSIRILTKGRRMNKKDVQVYASTCVDRSMLDSFDAFVILVQDPDFEERLIIVPSSDLREHYFTNPNAKKQRIVIPLLSRQTRRTARLNFGEYQNAWGKLRQVPEKTQRA